jgi:ABC-type phosphate transport system substrate-binding protein
MSRLCLRTLVLSALFLAPPARPEEALVVIVHPGSGITQLTKAEATDIFMGRQRRLPNGLLALPVEPLGPDSVRSRFYQLLVNLPLPQVRAYWATLYFTGKAQPPRQTGSPEETLEVVAANKGAIGFVEESRLDHRVRGVLRLDGKGIP